MSLTFERWEFIKKILYSIEIKRKQTQKIKKHELNKKTTRKKCT